MRKATLAGMQVVLALLLLATPGVAQTVSGVVQSADLAVTKAGTPDPVPPGSNITYTIVLTNNGPLDAQGVILTDLVPANTSFVSFTAPAGFTTVTPAVGGTGTITASATSLAASASATFTLVVMVDPGVPNGTTITNTATVTRTSPFDPVPGNDSATTTSTVNNEADLVVTKADTPDPVAAGGNITYTIVLTNNGPLDAQGVILTDLVPANTSFVSFTAPAGFTTVTPAVGGTGTITASATSLAASASATFTLVVMVDPGVPDGTTITNTATATSDTFDPDVANSSATTTTAVGAASEIPTLSPLLLLALLGVLLGLAMMRMKMG